MSDTTFPWKTSVMVFILNNTGQILLNRISKHWTVFVFPTVQKVDIKKMTTGLINQKLGSIYTRDDLVFQGVVDKPGGAIFIYSISVTDQPHTVTGVITRSWFEPDKLPVRTCKMSRDLLEKILRGENIGIAPAV